jgi:FHA domain-containing protein
MPARVCPACGKNYAADYAEAFCVCGIELVPGAPRSLGPSATRPPAGTRCLVLYGSDRQPLYYFPLTKDATLIGRVDPVEASFVDVDLRDYLDEATARKVSRRHALVLHSRATDGYTIRPLAGNTGTQIEADMVPPERDYPLPPGTHVILGGAVRFKFEVM